MRRGLAVTALAVLAVSGCQHGHPGASPKPTPTPTVARIDPIALLEGLDGTTLPTVDADSVDKRYRNAWNTYSAQCGDSSATLTRYLLGMHEELLRDLHKDVKRIAILEAVNRIGRTFASGPDDSCGSLFSLYDEQLRRATPSG